MGLFSKRRPSSPPPAGLVIDASMHDPAAARLLTRLTQQDWRAVRDFLMTVTDLDDRAFYLSICAAADGLQDWIGEWAQAEPRSTLPLLVRGAHAVYWAWEARGGLRANQTREEQFREFFRRLKLAENCLDEVVERDPEDVTGWAFLITSARGRQVDRAEAQRRFDEVVKRHPYHRTAHEQMLQYLCPKWCGSEEEMFGFARAAVAKAPQGSALGKPIAVAHIEKWIDLGGEESVAYMTQPEVVAELHAAADQSVRHPDFQRRPGWTVVHNLFALAFVSAGEWDAAAEQFDIIGDRITDWPWQYVDANPATAFETLRASAYLNRTAT